MKRFALVLLILVQCVSLVGCGQGSYEDGYEAGLAAASKSKNPEEKPVVDAPEEYEEQGFVLITDVIPDAILEIRYYFTFNFVGERIDAYEAPVACM